MNFSNLTIERLVNDSKKFEIKEEDKHYIKSYPYLLDFFKRKESFTESDIVQGIHMVYAWMPTTLKKIDWEQLPFVVATLNELKSGTYLHEGQLDILKISANNSMVGASKLLHFIGPEQYAIWDSKVVKYITGNKSSFGVDSVENYILYLDRLYQLNEDPKFAEIQREVNGKIGYEVSKLRAAEVVMFLTK